VLAGEDVSGRGARVLVEERCARTLSMDTIAVRTADLRRTYHLPRQKGPAAVGGRAWVDGLDVVTDTQAVRERITMAPGGETSGYGVLTVREDLWLFSQLCGIPRKEARPRGHPDRQARRP
jgi:hypothetical protein